MRYGVEIEDSLLEDIKQFCKLNNLKLNIYLSSVIRERFWLDKYGDMNILVNGADKSEEKPKEIKQNKKNVKKEKDVIKNDVEIKEKDDVKEIKNEIVKEVNKDNNEKREITTIRKRRILKTK